ncbi:AraC family transcriptional regulator [Sporosalibacterium faouarense]|uniref:AraC family transcriptional regulator n=1 Tax=Sporosalibacterium faouarense TaxID=516123 RepID=UPI00192A8638|nr:AraC family transcriptional regulator [Sporosalibacterium faouarense]
MEHLGKLNDSIDYIEENLSKDIDIKKVAEVACLSKFHYQRMFHILTGITVGEYIRKRRLTLAAQELAITNSKVIDIALKYGYSTPESFSKAFSKLHKISPSIVGNSENTLEAYPRLSFNIQLKGAEKMKYKIVEKEGFTIVGKGIRVSTGNGENFKRIPKFWEECNENSLCSKLSEKMGELGLMGVCTDMDMENDEFTYMIAIEKPDESLELDLTEIEISASTWAVFEAIGAIPDAIQDVTKRIFSEWFPSTGYKHADGPELEIYYPGDVNDENYKSEVWIPIIK